MCHCHLSPLEWHRSASVVPYLRFDRSKLSTHHGYILHVIETRRHHLSVSSRYGYYSQQRNDIVADYAGLDHTRVDVEWLETAPQIEDGVGWERNRMIRIRCDVVESQNIAQITVQPELRLPLQVRAQFLGHGIIRKFYSARFVQIECFDECFGTVAIAVVEVYVMHSFFMFHHHSGVSNVVPIVQVVYLGDPTLPFAVETYPSRDGRFLIYCANVLFGCMSIDEVLGKTR